MKKIIIGVSILVLLISCDTEMYSNYFDDYVYSSIEKIEYYDFSDYDTGYIDQIWEVGYFLNQNISYIPDVIDEWYSPKEVMERGGDDCEGWATTACALIYAKFGIKFGIALVHVGGRSIVNGGSINHAVIWDGDHTYYTPYDIHPTGYTDKDIGYRYTFDEIFKNVPEVE